MEALIITPVKDSLETTRKTIEAVSSSEINANYLVFNDFSNAETKNYLDRASVQHRFQLIHLEDITTNPSPNYKLILQKAYELAIDENLPLILIESDVIIQPTTIRELLKAASKLPNPGLVGAVTVDRSGNFNFPYAYINSADTRVMKNRHSISFCCTLMTVEFLKSYNFYKLPPRKDWFDIYLSKQSRKKGFNNYLLTDIKVLHLPHSSRPWKQLKYTHPLKYYLHKILKRRDRI